ncbi:MAG: EVE domain-containing protein [SAR324 cluster bacterium]|nr:EVE domain-containing protein [SAR324 cluster bacterium]
MRCWLMKSEPSAFSIEDLKNAPNGTDHWDGIRNYQARNLMRDEMKRGDRVLFYHSSADPTAVVGTARVVREAYPDHTALDPDSKYFDPKSMSENPRWVMVDIQFESQFAVPLTLAELRKLPQLHDMMLLKKGQRLSIQPVTEEEFGTIVRHAETLAKAG